MKKRLVQYLKIIGMADSDRNRSNLKFIRSKSKLQTCIGKIFNRKYIDDKIPTFFVRWALEKHNA
jgi:hypothetical protein